jgi:hypothetical protein
MILVKEEQPTNLYFLKLNADDTIELENIKDQELVLHQISVILNSAMEGA